MLKLTNLIGNNMELQLVTYQKLFDSLLLKDFSEISSLEVLPTNDPLVRRPGFKLNIYLKPANEIESLVSCNHLKKMIKKRISDLNKYIGQYPWIDMRIYFEGEMLCNTSFYPGEYL